MESFINVAALFSPFISAGIAGYVAYSAGSKRAKADAFMSRRLEALEKVHTALIKLKSYVSKRMNEIEGNEYAPHPDEEENINNFCFPLWEVIEEQSLFFSKIERKNLDDLSEKLSMCRSMERAGKEYSNGEGAIELYKKISSTTSSAIEALYSEMRKEYGI